MKVEYTVKEVPRNSTNTEPTLYTISMQTIEPGTAEEVDLFLSKAYVPSSLKTCKESVNEH